MHEYKIIIYWSLEDNSYIADVPELPGCMADGKSHDEVIKNVQVIINEWIETALESGRDIPWQKESHVCLRAIDSFAENLGNRPSPGPGNSPCVNYFATASMP
jgi:predicted RNase H-like HicB family nuclease